MPLYEFRCLKCNQCFEFLVMKKEEQVELKCPECQSEDFERIMSVAGHCMGDGAPKNSGATPHSRECPGGSCTTYDIPGHSRRP